MPELASHVKSSGSRKLNISRPIWIRCAMRRSEMQMTPPEYHCTTRRPTIMQSSTVMPELASHVKSSGSRKLNISRPIWIRCAMRRSEMQMTPPEYHCTTRRPTIMQSSTVMPELASHVKSSGSRKLNISRPIWIRCALRRSEMQMTPPEYHCTTRRPTIMQSSTVMPELASHVKSSCSRKLNISRPIWIRCAMRRSEMQMTPPEYHCTTRRPTIMQSSTVMPELASHVKSSGSRKLNISRPIWIRCAMRRSEMQMTPPEYHCTTRRRDNHAVQHCHARACVARQIKWFAQVKHKSSNLDTMCHASIRDANDTTRVSLHHSSTDNHAVQHCHARACVARQIKWFA